jgi:hypothetical protein
LTTVAARRGFGRVLRREGLSYQIPCPTHGSTIHGLQGADLRHGLGITQPLLIDILQRGAVVVGARQNQVGGFLRRAAAKSPVERPMARSLEAWRGGRARRPTYGKDCDGWVPAGLEALVRPAGGIGGGRSSGGEAGRHRRERHARAGAARLRRRGGRRGSDAVRRRRGGDEGCVAGLVGLCGAIEEERTKQRTY